MTISPHRAAERPADPAQLSTEPPQGVLPCGVRGALPAGLTPGHDVAGDEPVAGQAGPAAQAEEVHGRAVAAASRDETAAVRGGGPAAGSFEQEQHVGAGAATAGAEPGRAVLITPGGYLSSQLVQRPTRRSPTRRDGHPPHMEPPFGVVAGFFVVTSMGAQSGMIWAARRAESES